MNKEFIPYEQALELKELGFNEDCFMVWDSPNTMIPDHEAGSNKTNINAPLYQQAFRWFREKYHLWSMIYPRNGWNYVIQRIDETTSCTGESFHKVEMKSYEEAELECLKKLIKCIML